MIGRRNFVRARWKRLGSRRAWAPARFGGTGPCSRSANFWDVADDRSEAKRLAFASRRRKCSSVMFQNALPLWHMEQRRTFDPVRPGSLLLVRRSHGYPVFLPLLEGSSGGCVVLTLPVHDDAMRLCPRGRGCQITIRAPDWARETTSPVRSRLRPPRSPSC